MSKFEHSAAGIDYVEYEDVGNISDAPPTQAFGQNQTSHEALPDYLVPVTTAHMYEDIRNGNDAPAHDYVNVKKDEKILETCESLDDASRENNVCTFYDKLGVNVDQRN